MTLLGGELPVQVLDNNTYVPVLGGREGDVGTELEDAVKAALSETKTVLLVGPRGSGKTTTLEKFIVANSNNPDLQAFAHIYYFRLCDINSLESPISFKTFLHKCRHSQPVSVAKSEGVLFILDGFELFQHNLDPSENNMCSDQDQALSVPCFFSSLLHGYLMPGAGFLVASQATANLKFLNGVKLDVIGFLKPQRGAYFEKVFTDPVTAKSALDHFEKTLGFYDFSKSPQFCHTVCSVYNLLIKSGTKLPLTLTQMFVHTFVYLMRDLGEKGRIDDAVRALGSLASYCALESQLSLTKEKLCEFDLPAEFPIGQFLHVWGESDKAMYSWHSPLIQEFLLAVSVLLGLTPGSVGDVLEKYKRSTTFLDIFLSGLCEQVHWRPLEAVLGPADSKVTFDFKNWLKKLCDRVLPGINKEDHCRCFRLLHQMQNENVIKAITPSARLGLGYGNRSLQDYVALNYVMTRLGEIEQINLYMTRNLTEEMAGILAPTMAISKGLILGQCSFEDGAVTHVASALSGGIATSLDLSTSRLSETQFKSLCTGLKSSKLQSIQCSNGKLTERSCEELVPVLTSATSQLSVLQLYSNQFGDQGLKHLCKALKSQHNRVKELNLQGCSLTGASMEDLSTALSSGHSHLLNLNLSRNEIGDRGVQALSKGLQHPFCKLESVSLSDCGLTEASCPSLAEALMSNQCLTELDLSLNEFGHEGALILCKALQRPGCPVEKLSLVGCELTEATFVELASMLKSGSPSLKTLSVGVNKVGEQGVQHLWVALRHPSCELEELDVEMTGLTDACVEDLCTALKASKTLKRLELHNNSLTNSSVPALIRVMQESPNMEHMNVQYNDFGDEMFELFETCSKIIY